MANFMEGGMDAFRALAYGDHHPANVAYMEHAREYGTEGWNESASRFVTSIQDSYERVLGADVRRLAKAVKRQAHGLAHRNSIQYLNSIDRLQAPPKEMIPYLMVEPTTRKKYRKQLCAGYDSDYVDLYGSHETKAHPLYKNAINGMVMDDDDGWSAVTHYPDMLEEDLADLEFTDQVDIINTWERMASAMLTGGEDPTSRFNSNLD